METNNLKFIGMSFATIYITICVTFEVEKNCHYNSTDNHSVDAVVNIFSEYNTSMSVADIVHKNNKSFQYVLLCGPELQCFNRRTHYCLNGQIIPVDFCQDMKELFFLSDIPARKIYFTFTRYHNNECLEEVTNDHKNFLETDGFTDKLYSIGKSIKARKICIYTRKLYDGQTHFCGRGVSKNYWGLSEPSCLPCTVGYESGKFNPYQVYSIFLLDELYELASTDSLMIRGKNKNIHIFLHATSLNTEHFKLIDILFGVEQNTKNERVYFGSSDTACYVMNISSEYQELLTADIEIHVYKENHLCQSKGDCRFAFFKSQPVRVVWTDLEQDLTERNGLLIFCKRIKGKVMNDHKHFLVTIGFSDTLYDNRKSIKSANTCMKIELTDGQTNVFGRGVSTNLLGLSGPFCLLCTGGYESRKSTQNQVYSTHMLGRLGEWASTESFISDVIISIFLHATLTECYNTRNMDNGYADTNIKQRGLYTYEIVLTVVTFVMTILLLESLVFFIHLAIYRPGRRFDSVNEVHLSLSQNAKTSYKSDKEDQLLNEGDHEDHLYSKKKPNVLGRILTMMLKKQCDSLRWTGFVSTNFLGVSNNVLTLKENEDAEIENEATVNNEEVMTEGVTPLISVDDVANDSIRKKVCRNGFLRNPDQQGIQDSSVEEYAEQEEEVLCKICYMEELSVVFLPCSHMVACESCSRLLRRCAVCRSLIKAMIKAEIK